VPFVHRFAFDVIAYDALDLAFSTLHPRGAVLYRSELSGTWGLSAGEGAATFHVLESGSCRACIGGQTLTLEAGDLLVLPHGSAVAFRSSADADAPLVEELIVQHPPGPDGVLRIGGEAGETRLICGVLDFDDAIPHPVLAALPTHLVVRRADDRSAWLAHTLDFLSCEARAARPGAATVMGHLAGILFVQAVRAFAESMACRRSREPSGWIGALADAHVGPALRAIVTAPERKWTVESLGHEAGLGRSAFASRFRKRVGETPMQHVTRWRVHRASRLLRSDLGLAEIAARVGYENQAAFGRAFKRWTGHPPGTKRQQGRAM
jgi:AraC-like DNA-binding protein